MKFLVYTVEPLDLDTQLYTFDSVIDKDIGKIMRRLEEMNLERVLENQSINLLADNLKFDEDRDIVTVDIYKQTTPGKAHYQLTEEEDEISIQEILSEHDDAFVQGAVGVKKTDDEIHLLVESKFGSFFVSASRGINIEPQFSGETVRSIRESETIGRTTIEFNDDYDLTASLWKPPEDADIREEEGFGRVDLLNKITSLFDISKAHQMSLDIDRDEWLQNVEIFDDLVETGIVTSVKVTGTKNGSVRLGEGGDRAIRKTIRTNSSGKKAVQEAFSRLSQ